MNRKSGSAFAVWPAIALAAAGCSASSATAPGTVASASSASASAVALTPSNARVGHCINLGNHLEGYPTEGSWGRAINDRDLADIAAAGFETVRLPVRWSAHASAKPPYTIDPAWMARVDEVIGQARAAGLRVILNHHHFEELYVDPAAEQARFVAHWRQISDHFAGADDMLWFELLNEPHKNIDNANLLSVIEPALAVVREKHPTRPVIIGGQDWSNVSSLATLELPDDPYLIATFHYYEPFAFTHQGAKWPDEKPPLGRVYGGEQDRALLASSVEQAKHYMQRTKRPLLMGEYGAYDPIPLDQRVAYYADVSQAFGQAGVEGCVWNYTHNFQFRDERTGEWKAQLLRAIGMEAP